MWVEYNKDRTYRSRLKVLQDDSHFYRSWLSSFVITINSINAQNGENEIISEKCSTSKK